MPILAGLLATVFALIAALHLYWTVRGVGTGAGVPSRADGTPVIRPGRLASFAVTAACILAALIVLGRGHLLDVGLPPAILHVGIWGIAGVFFLRTIGEFRYVGLFKRVRGTPFADWDTRLFTPLCAAIAGAAVALAAT